MEYLQQLEGIRKDLEQLVLRFQDFSTPLWKSDPLDLRIERDAIVLIQQHLQRELTEEESGKVYHFMCNIRNDVRKRLG